MQLTGHIGGLGGAAPAAHAMPGTQAPVMPWWQRRHRRLVPSVLCSAVLLALAAHFAEATEAAGGTAIELIELGCLAAVAAIAAALILRRALSDAKAGENAARLAVQGMNDEAAAARAATIVKSRYLASISHEIRAPLNAIYGYAQLMEIEDAVSPREAARIIRRSAEHLTSLVDGLLDISQIESGVMRVTADVVNFPDFLDQIFWMMRPAAQARGLAFAADFSEHLPGFVRMDHSRLRQVLINLLSNAIKYTDAGSVTFRVRYAGQVAVFEIADTGPGISLADRERIFEPFERGGGDSQLAQPGVGLGLPIARAITQILGGELELVDTTAPGSCFRVSLMLASVAPRSEGQQVMRNIIGYEGPRRSALIVDDDVRQLSFLRSLLESLGFDVSSVPDGETAIRFAPVEFFDFALLDISMPGMSGWDVASHLRARFGADIHIIIVSANTAELHDPQVVLSPTAQSVHDHFLIKPFEFGALLEAIGGLLGLTWKWDQVEGGGEPAAAPTRSSALPEAAWAHVDRMKQLIQIGHVRAIEAEIAGLATAAPEAAPLVSDLYACLDRFDLAAMTRRLSDV